MPKVGGIFGDGHEFDRARCLNRSRLVEELLETWQIEHEAAMLVQDLEQLVQECLELAELLERAWQRIKAEAYQSGLSMKQAA